MKRIALIIGLCLLLIGCNQEENMIDPKLENMGYNNEMCELDGGITFDGNCNHVWTIEMSAINLTVGRVVYEEEYATMDKIIINCEFPYNDSCYHFTSYEAILEWKGTKVNCYLINDTRYSMLPEGYPKELEKYKSIILQEGCFKEEIYNRGHGGYCEGGFKTCEIRG